jgi:PAN domain-containing protein
MKKSTASFAALLLCVTATATFAQSPGDIINRIENFFHSGVAKAARSRWSKLPETEYACVNQKLQERGDNLPSLIERGVFPNDRRVAKARSQCQGASASQQFQKLDKRAYKRSGQDIVMTASHYHDCENACGQSSSCAALTYFRAEKMCRMMQSTTELETDEGADSAIRIESITGSVAPRTPRPD